MSQKRNQEIYNSIAHWSAQLITEQYSTSFASAIKLIKEPKRSAIYDIYGYVRLADEIVDTWRPQNMADRLKWFELETYAAVSSGNSSNPIIHAFALTVNRYGIKKAYIRAFLKSMQTDIDTTQFNEKSYKTYIYGSAEVVGLMCLGVFCDGQKSDVAKLSTGARALGAAFQKVNFLRDISEDQVSLKRFYFPGVTGGFTEENKAVILKDIARDLHRAKRTINELPPDCREAVRLAYKYYLALFHKIEKESAQQLLQKRVRVNNLHKSWLFAQAWLHRSLGR